MAILKIFQSVQTQYSRTLVSGFRSSKPKSTAVRFCTGFFASLEPWSAETAKSAKNIELLDFFYQDLNFLTGISD